MQEMIKQAVFNKVASHLLTQKRRSVQPGSEVRCMYRGINNTSCAIGCLIPDNKYSKDMEGITMMDLRAGQSESISMFRNALGFTLTDSTMEFLGKIQRIHDSYLPWSWKKALLMFADLHKLSPLILNNYPD